MSKIDGKTQIEIAGVKYTLCYDWQALAEVEAAHGDSPNLFKPEIVASVASFGLIRNHPEMTPEKITELSPPLVPFITAVQAALQYAYFGATDVVDDGKKNTDPSKVGLWRRFLRLFGMV